MADVCLLIDAASRSKASVLITGESGTGKNVVAREIHARSSRSAAPYVEVNLAGLAPGVFESELFGHVKGAFTGADRQRCGRFEVAHTGTLLLDEIGAIPIGLQAKLLQVIETRRVTPVGANRGNVFDTRVISATNANLDEEVEQQSFRADLFYRLNTLEICLPPLRQRRSDIVLLAEKLLRRHAEIYEKPNLYFSDEAMSRLLQYSWPGNVRELAHVVERAVVIAHGRIGVERLPLKGFHRDAHKPQRTGQTSGSLNFDEMTIRLIDEALERNGGNVKAAASALGVSKGFIYRRVRKVKMK
jgi:transcriptional regulator with PAS, ATPase and Fis domain